MKDYYQILGVRREASFDEIKRAYRKLVVIHHPDKSKDPLSNEKIKEINEAYDVLGDPEKKRSYDLGSFKPLVETFTQTTPPHRDPAYRRRPPGYVKSERVSIRELMETYGPVMAKGSLTAFIFCLVLLVDYMLPFTKSTEKVIDIHPYEGLRRSYAPSQVIVTNERRYKLSSNEISHFNKNDLIRVSTSRVFEIPVFAEASEGHRTRFYSTIYGNFVFMPLILLITSSLGIFLKNTELRFNLGIVNFLILALNLFFLFSHKLFV